MMINNKHVFKNPIEILILSFIILLIANSFYYLKLKNKILKINLF